ncbi:hypothetical protein [Amycolatopsis sp. NPDC058986]|uniref:hypothetical protein n=1 Tax=unclassified Amycolatopsis TaxID=2618356 RepID=UPI003672A357
MALPAEAVAELPGAACTRPGVNPDWWDVASPKSDNRLATAICESCPVLDQCRLQAAIFRPQGVIQGGRRWDTKTP